MAKRISHDREEESIGSKTGWFQSPSISERMELFCSFIDLAIEINPKLSELQDAQQTKKRIRIISKT